MTYLVPVASPADISAGWGGIVSSNLLALVVVLLLAMVTWFLFFLALVFGWGDRG